MKRKQKLMSEDEIDDKLKEMEFEKGDGLALFIAAMVTFLPVVLLLLGIFVAIIWLIF